MLDQETNWRRMKPFVGRPISEKPAVCIIVENNPAPFDRRVWQEACALRDAGYRVSVISPKGVGANAGRETVDGVEIYRHRMWEADSPSGYFWEYLGAVVCEFWLALKIYARTRFRVIQACNPPDVLFVIGAFFKLLGVRFVFDHHDLCPELFEDRFGKRRHLLHRVVRFCEYLTFRTADVSLATNESYREIAMNRGRMERHRVFVVRSCLDLDKVHLRAPKPELKAGKPYLAVYLGVMGPQDGVHLLLESIALLVKSGRRDTQFTLIGYGTETPRLKLQAASMGLEELVTFTGRIPDEELEEYLSTADLALAPDPANGLNDKSTMNKILHYMAYGLPIVQYDLTEGRRSAGDASLYARNNDPAEFATLIARLIDSEPLRNQLGREGRRRIEERLNWATEKQQLLRAYDAALLPKDQSAVTCSEAKVQASRELPGMKYVMVTAARDEGAHIEKTIVSVIRQTRRPTQWVIVDDGSSDNTGAIIDRYARQHQWITPVHRANRGFRQAGGGVVAAFYGGYERIESPDWDFIVKLDADLDFAPDYFERCLAEFAEDSRLGIAGGGIYHATSDGVLTLETTPVFHVRGATKIYRRECWTAIGGLVRAAGWDTIDEAKANMLGWRTRSFTSLQLLHHRVTGGAEGAWRDCVKNGRANYIAGYHPVFMMLKCVRRVVRKPYLIGSLGLVWGFSSAYFKRVPRVNDRALIRYVRNQQIRRLLCLESIWR